MKWIKLDCDYPDDPKIERLCEALGFEIAMAFWPHLLALVGRYGAEKCALDLTESGDFNLTLLAKRFHCRENVLLSRLEVAAKLKLISETALSEKVIYIPKMLTRLDDYSKKKKRKAGQSTDNVRTLSVQDTDNVPLEEKRREEILPIVPHSESETEAIKYSPDFEIFWTAYPRKVGKGDAWKAWRKLKPSTKLIDQIVAAIGTARQSHDWKKQNGEFIPHPATWLNGQRWNDSPKTDNAQNGLHGFL